MEGEAFRLNMNLILKILKLLKILTFIFIFFINH